MRLRRPETRLLVCLVFVAALLGGGACQSNKTPVQKLADVNATVKTAYVTIANARDAGWIKQSQIDQYKSAFDALDAALDQAQADQAKGDVTGANAAVNAAMAALAQLQPLIDAAAAKKGGH